MKRMNKKELKELLDRWQVLVAEGDGDPKKLYDDTTDAIKQLDEFVQEESYHAGFVDGLTTYAIWEDGRQVVGCSRTSLKKAQAEAKQAYNYFPRNE